MLKVTVIVTAMKVTGTVGWVVYSILLARLLDLEAYGLVMYAVTVMAIAGPLTCLGYNSAMLKFGSVARQTGEIAGFLGLLALGRRTILVATPVAAAAVLAAFALTAGLDSTAGRLVALFTIAGLPLFGLMILHREALRALDHPAWGLFGFNVLRPLVPTVASLALAAAGLLDVVTATGCILAGLLLVAVVDFHRIAAFVPATAERSEADRPAWRAVARPMWLTEAMNNVVARGDVLVVGALLGLEATAIYVTAQRLAWLVGFVLDAARMGLEPEIARGFARRDWAGLQRRLAVGSLISLLTGVPVALVLVFGGGAILDLFGPAFRDGWPVLAILVAGQLGNVVVGPISAVMRMTDMQRATTVVLGASAAAQCIAVAAGAVFLGVEGAAMGVAAVMVATGLAQLVRVRRHLGLRAGPGSGMLSRPVLTALWQDLRAHLAPSPAGPPR